MRGGDANGFKANDFRNSLVTCVRYTTIEADGRTFFQCDIGEIRAT